MHHFLKIILGLISIVQDFCSTTQIGPNLEGKSPRSRERFIPTPKQPFSPGYKYHPFILPGSRVRFLLSIFLRTNRRKSSTTHFSILGDNLESNL